MIRLALFFLVLFLAAVFDIRKRIIPDWMPFLIAGVSLIPSEPVYLTGLFVALPLLIAGITVGGIGGGDIKLTGACGLVLGFERTLMIDMMDACHLDFSRKHLENDNPAPGGISPLLDMFIITNRMNNNGAIYMFDDETMQRVAGKLGDNLIILPSSVHETIVYSEECGPDIRRAKDMVQAVNQTELREEDFLSGEIYRYDKDSHTLSKVQVPEHEEIFMPDKVSMEEMHAYGYVWDGMLPLTKERALELMDTDLLLFKLYEDGAEGMIETKEEILSHDGLFGVERDSWMNYLNAQSQNETNGMTLEM